MIQEKRLMMRFNRGETEALRDIYALYKDDLVSLAAALLHNKSTAEDAVHDVFARLIQNRTHLHITQNLRQYLMTSVANAARRYFQAQHRASIALTAAADAAGISDPNPPELAMLSDERSRRLADALAALPYEQREVILLRHFSELKFKQIAAIQNASINTIQGRYRYGLDKLRSLLNGEMI